MSGFDWSAEYWKDNDPQVKDLDYKYAKLASDESVEKTKKAMEALSMTVHVFNTSKEALEFLKTAIPDGASVHNAGSTTLAQIGFVEHLKNQTGWRNLHGEVIAEKDPYKSWELRRLHALTADYFLSSCSAITETGTIVACDLTGTRTGGFTCTGKNLFVVAGTNKIVPTMNDAIARQANYCLPLESARVRVAYKAPQSAITNVVAIHGSNPYNPKRINIILIKESLGY